MHMYISEERIVLAQVCTWDKQTYIFDLKEKPELMHDGQLWRLIEAESLTKVRKLTLYQSISIS